MNAQGHIRTVLASDLHVTHSVTGSTILSQWVESLHTSQHKWMPVNAAGVTLVRPCVARHAVRHVRCARTGYARAAAKRLTSAQADLAPARAGRRPVATRSRAHVATQTVASSA